MGDAGFGASRHERWFDAGPESVTLARHFVSDLLADASVSAEAGLLVSELASNAVRHAKSEFGVSVRTKATAVVVAVTDHSNVMPSMRAVHPLSTHGGRGLALVDAIATRWGVDPIEGNGKTTWFELTDDHQTEPPGA